jgi:hypothetical protein
MLSSSPDRGSFSIDCQLKAVEEGTKTAEKAQEMIDFYKSHAQHKAELEATEAWKIDNMEYDLRSTQWIIDKVKSDDVYAQHLYAAMCNRDFTKNDVIPILTEKRWSCSWRHAGGIIADMQQKGDYIDWYCSGIRNEDDLDENSFGELTKDQQLAHLQAKAYVSEGVVTDEIQKDLLKLGWIVLDGDIIDY